MMVPDPLAPDEWPTRLAEMVDKLLKPRFWSINTPSQIIELLLNKEDDKFGWPPGLTVLRLAELVGLAKHLSYDMDVLRQRLTEYEPGIVRDMYGSKDFNGIFDAFVREI